MDKQYESGRTILKVIAFIVIIGLLLTLIVRICQKTGSSAKADDIAKAVAERVEIYRPEIQKQRPKLTIKTALTEQPLLFKAKRLSHPKNTKRDIFQLPSMYLNPKISAKNYHKPNYFQPNI